jgi:diketogulonate reductase-like aldo/keto reductase
MSSIDTGCKIPLSDSAAMPAVGLGSWKIPKEQASDVVREAMRVGYSHWGCDCDYGNVPEVGAGLPRFLRMGTAGVRRHGSRRTL